VVNNQNTPLKLRVLDFDDTIAHTGEKVQLKTPAGYKELSSAEYAVYEPAEGEEYDDQAFKQFDAVDPELASPVESVFNVLKNFLLKQEGNRIILILTARKQVVEQSVREFLVLEFQKEQDPQKRSILIDSVSDIEFAGVGDSNPQKKVAVIKDYIENYNVTEVSFFDDSMKNVSAVKEYLDSIGIANDVAHIRPEGDRTRLIRKFGKD